MIQTYFLDDKCLGYWVPIEVSSIVKYHGPYDRREEAETVAAKFGWFVNVNGDGDEQVILCPGNMISKRWQPWFEDCPNCGSDTEVLTNDPRPAYAWEHDPVRCTECYCLGWVIVDGNDVGTDWPDDMCAKCYRSVGGGYAI